MADPEKQMVVEDGSDHEDLSSDEEAPGAGGHASASSLLQDPAVMAALQGKLGAMVGTPSGYVASLPAPVRRRIKALKKLQLEATKIEAKFYEEVRDANMSKKTQCVLCAGAPAGVQVPRALHTDLHKADDDHNRRARANRCRGGVAQ